ncbi:MAG: restriction endonuclease subunit S [Lachnoanaerobaculum sp.]|nr:restriction endonuclease subunit S [Lachnoanaerobaculum sp.]
MLSIPLNISEQKKVGDFFISLNHLITLHQSKSFGHILKAIVSCTLSWEQSKTSELFKITRGYVLAANITDGNKSGDNPYPVYSSQTKDNGLMGYYKDYLYENAITWTTDGANAGTVNYRDEKFYCTNVCGVLLGDKVTPNQMLAEAINNVAKSYVSYVGNPKLMNNVMAEICIWLPSEDTERKAISSFVYSLDYLITLHQLEPFQLIFKAIAYRIIDYTKSKPPSHRK